MIGKHKFRVGQRVRLSVHGLSATRLLPRTKENTSGVVVGVDEFNCPTDHPDYIEPDRRRKRIGKRGGP